MKRSGMLQIIREELMYREADSFTEVANDILIAIEKAGMSPPGYLKPIPFEADGKQYPLVPGDFKNSNGVWCTPGRNEWEPENDN